jgi:hypothetical protein
LSYALLALWVMRNLWTDPSGRILAGNRSDHSLFLFLVEHGDRVVFHGASLLHSDRLNAPVGVNMMANTSVLALSLPMAPITHVFGAAVTVALLLTAGLAGTALAWQWWLCRGLKLGPAASWIGGLWGGFAPGWLSHASGHVNFVCGFVMPFIVDQVMRLRLAGRVWRGGITLGLLLVTQVFINEEMLLIAAIALAVFVVAFAVMNIRAVREWGLRFVAGAAVAALVAGVLLAYPLWYQFAGPGHYHGQPFPLDRFATSLGSLVALPRESVFGSFATAARLSASPTEDTIFWGPAACVMIIVAVVMVRRSVAARAAAIAALILLLMSFGSHIRTTERPGGPASPLGWTMHVPMLDLVTTPRYGLAATAIAGVLLALAADKALRRTAPPERLVAPGDAGSPQARQPTAPRPVHRARQVKVLFGAGLALALIPLFPRPVPTVQAPPVPAFFARAMWHPYLRGTDRTVVIVPLPNHATGTEAMRLAASSGSAFPMAAGYFMGPKDPPRDTTGAWASPPRFTTTLINEIRTTGDKPTITLARRAAIDGDLHYWKAAIVVLLPDAPHRSALRRFFTAVLGAPATVGGVTLWRTPEVRVPGAGSAASAQRS